MKKRKYQELKNLFEEIKENRKKAMEEFYHQYHKIVYAIAFSILKNKEDAEDVMQIVFEKIQTIDKTKLPSDKEMIWLYTLTKNETLNYLKKKKGEISLETIYEIENKDNEIAIDRTGKKEGRGAYICDDEKCLEKVIKNKRLERVFEVEITQEIYESLRGVILDK